jgi:hypothetical protein
MIVGMRSRVSLPGWLVLAAPLLLVALSYLPVLRTPFLADWYDYGRDTVTLLRRPAAF